MLVRVGVLQIGLHWRCLRHLVRVKLVHIMVGIWLQHDLHHDAVVWPLTLLNVVDIPHVGLHYWLHKLMLVGRAGVCLLNHELVVVRSPLLDSLEQVLPNDVHRLLVASRHLLSPLVVYHRLVSA